MSFLKKPFKKLRDISTSSLNSNDSDKESATASTPSKTEGIPDTPVGALTPNNGTATPPVNGESASDRRKSRDMIQADRVRASIDRERTKAENKKRQSMARIEDEKFLTEGPPELTKLYRPFSMNMSKRWNHENRIRFRDIDPAIMEDRVITFRARIHATRRMSAKLVFIVFRQQSETIQGVLTSYKAHEELEEGEDNHGTISLQMVRTIEHYPTETIVVVHAKLRKAPKRVKNATIHDYEFEVYEVHKVGDLTENVPFSVYDAENINRDVEGDDDDDDEDDSLYPGQSENSTPAPGTPRASIDMIRSPRVTSPAPVAGVHKSKSVSRKSGDLARASGVMSRSSMDVYKQQRSLPLRVRLNSRIVDLRTGPSQAIFRIQSGICNLFRSYLDDQGFIEIHTPKLQGGASESGATVFELNYFGRPAFLAQSPQLPKQMAIASDFDRVYEIGPVFRAEDSNTPRHLTEYTGLDLEMALEEHYHEALDIIDGMFKNLWKGIYDRYDREISLISEFYPQEKVVWLEETPRIPFVEGVQMLIDDGWVDEDGNPPALYEDLATRAEIRLGAIVKEKYKTDYYILDKFPSSVRPFYAMPDPTDDRVTNSFDIFMRGQEILTGGQRIHDSKFLEKRMKTKGIRPETMTEYLEGFRWGAPPHAGCGIGLERLTYLFLNLGNIRIASMFPRDPKSLPAVAKVAHLRHEEASTLNPPWERNDLDEYQPQTNGTLESRLQPLEKLIANYGDAANTSWLDQRYHVWRHASTGAAQGFIIHGNFAIAVGDPLCHKTQKPQIISAYLQYLKDDHKNLKSLWMIASAEVEEYLAEKFSWRTLSCAAEERIKPKDIASHVAKEKDLARKIRHAENEGIKEIDIPFNEEVPADIVQKIDARIADWQSGRKGQQVHLTEIRPWIDQAHRRYFYSTTPSNGQIHALLVLHQLSPENGWQIKFALEFPNAPSGTSESLILHGIKAISAFEPECKSATFGTGAAQEMQGGRNIGKLKVKTLKKAYDAINKQFHLTGKSDFREKLGAWNDPSFVCYPRGGLGASGIKAIMGFLEEEG